MVVSSPKAAHRAGQSTELESIMRSTLRISQEEKIVKRSLLRI